MKSHLDYPFENALIPISEPQTINVSGWAAIDSEPFAYIKTILNHKLQLISPPNLSRPDVCKAFKEFSDESKLYGFNYSFQTEDVIKGENHLEIFGIDRSGEEISICSRTFTAAESNSADAFAAKFTSVPPHFLIKVNGTSKIEQFLSVGCETAQTIKKEIGTLVDRSRVLDFGCGLGRVLIPMKEEYQNCDFIGYDIDPTMLRWLKHLMPGDNLAVCSSTQEIEDQSIDLIYAISVFTHLDSTTEYWLNEIKRTLKPDGRAFLTYHDETLFSELAGSRMITGSFRGEILKGRYVTGEDSSEGGIAKGVFYSTDYWEELLKQYFHVEKSIPRGLCAYQSVSIVKNHQSEHTMIIPKLIRNYISEIENELFKIRSSKEIEF